MESNHFNVRQFHQQKNDSEVEFDGAFLDRNDDFCEEITKTKIRISFVSHLGSTFCNFFHQKMQKNTNRLWTKCKSRATVFPKPSPELEGRVSNCRKSPAQQSTISMCKSTKLMCSPRLQMTIAQSISRVFGLVEPGNEERCVIECLKLSFWESTHIGNVASKQGQPMYAKCQSNCKKVQWSHKTQEQYCNWFGLNCFNGKIGWTWTQYGINIRKKGQKSNGLDDDKCPIAIVVTLSPFSLLRRPYQNCH